MEEKEKEKLEEEDKENEVAEDDLVEEDEVEEEKEEKKPQDRETNKLFAEQRRRKQAEEKAKKFEEENARLREQLRSNLKGSLTQSELDELGINEVKSEEDTYLVEEYKKAKLAGLENPSTIAYRKLWQKNKEAEAEKEKKSSEDKKQKLVADDTALFNKTFNKSIVEALNDEDFNEMFGDAIKPGNVTKLYSAYQKIKLSDKKSEDEKKKLSIPPSPNSKAKTSYLSMTKEEKIKYLKEQNLI